MRYDHLTGVGDADHFNAVALDADGNIIAAGYANDTATGDQNWTLVARFTPSGALDPNFGGGTGWVKADGLWRGMSVAIRPGGEIVVGGSDISNNFGVQQFRPDGSLDTSFHGTGTLIYAFPSLEGNATPARGLALGPNGNIVLAGTVEGATGGYDWGVVSITPDAVMAPQVALASSPVISSRSGSTTAPLVGSTPSPGILVLGPAPDAWPGAPTRGWWRRTWPRSES